MLSYVKLGGILMIAMDHYLAPEIRASANNNRVPKIGRQGKSALDNQQQTESIGQTESHQMPFIPAGIAGIVLAGIGVVLLFIGLIYLFFTSQVRFLVLTKLKSIKHNKNLQKFAATYYCLPKK